MKDIRGYEGQYAVTKNGEVWSYKRKKYLKPLRRGKYRQVALFKEGNVKRFLIHRLVAKEFILNPENKPEINHKNNIQSDNRITNLEWCTRSENMLHAYTNGFIKRDFNISGLFKGHPMKGEKHPLHKLTKIQVEEIKKRAGKGLYSILAKEFRVSDVQIRRIALGLAWNT